MTAAFLCDKAGIIQSVIDNQTAYIASWLKRLQSDPKMVISAASKAQKAADHILGITHNAESTADAA
jgi:antirestriction protein ArdC